MLHVAGDVAHRSFAFTNIRSSLVIVAAVTAALASRGDTTAAAILALAPYDVFTTGFERPSGLVVQNDGTALVTDAGTGTLNRVTPDGIHQIVLDHLQQPQGVAVAGGDVFVLEPTRVLRLGANGVLSVVSTLQGKGRAITADPDGRLWIALRPDGRLDEVILRLEPSGALTPVASGFLAISSLAADRAGLYVGLSSLVGETADRTALARLRWAHGGEVGAVESLLRNSPGVPNGLAIDAAGDVFMTGWIRSDPAMASGLIVKRRRAGDLAPLASGLAQPGAAAFGPGRDLFVIELSAPARVLRFKPPPAPAVRLGSFVNQTPVRIAGVAQPTSVVQASRLNGGAALLATGVADVLTGVFTVAVPMLENAATQLAFTSTARAGTGLVSLPTIRTVVHDDHLPQVEILEPPDSTQTNSGLVMRARASDDGSGIGALRLMIDEVTKSTVVSNGDPLTTAATIDTHALPEGFHTLTAAASDRALNWSASTRQVVVDRTPPETLIVSGPPDNTAERSVSFLLGGFDAYTSDLEYSWRLDEGPWSPFSSQRTVQFASLAPGRHQFEVSARDRAANVDATPARQAFTVTALKVAIVEPLPGAVIATSRVWIRGTVASGSEWSVRVLLPSSIAQSAGIDALPAPVESGTFAVEVPVVPGVSELTVVARDIGGEETSATVAVSVLPDAGPDLRLEASPAAGLAPLTVRLFANGLPVGSVYSLDLESDGTPDYVGQALAEQEFAYAQPGIYLATARITTPDGRTLMARGAIEVYDRARLEARVRATWSNFKAALRAGDAAAAASFVHSDRRAAWTQYFSRLTPAQFVATDSMFTDITLVEVTPGRVECEMLRDVGGLLYSFPVSFEVDVDGGLKLWQF